MKKLGKIKIKRLYDRCLNLARRKPAEFFMLKKMRGAHGYCNWSELEFNPSGELLATAYHECIHFIEPEWCETQVLYAEKRIINNLSFLEHARFLKYIAMKLYKSELQRHAEIRRKKKKKITKKK
jgi:hypothetical protein